MLYECLTGRLPFPGEGFVAVAMRQCSEPLPDPRALAPAVPGWLAATAQRAAAKEPADRYPDAAAFVAALLSEEEPESGGTAVMPVLDGDTQRRRRPGRRRAVWIGSLVALAAVGGIAAIVVLGPGGGDSTPPAAAAAPLTLSSVTDFDPLGDGRERPDLLPLASDGDPLTAWYTENYQDSPELGGLKKGVGLSLALPAPAVATEMVIDSPTPGAHFEVLGPGSGIERQTLAQGTLTGGRQVIPLTRAAASGSYVLWLTSLVPDGKGGYWAGVGEVRLRGVPNSQ